MRGKTLAVLMALCGLWILSCGAVDAASVQSELRILASTFPVYLFARNVANGAQGVVVQLMLPASMGCPHDYVLTPGDMEKISRADIFVANGLGLEEFLGDPLKRANPKVVLVDSSRGIEDILSEEGHEHAGHTEEAHGHAPTEQADPHRKGAAHREESHAKERGGHHAHDHGAPNPHLFASPRMAALMVRNIASGLAAADPRNADLYKKNGETYAGALDALAEEARSTGKALTQKRVVTQHAVFDYLARDMGLEIVAVLREDPGMEPSAAEMLRLVRLIKQKKVAALFTEPQYPAKVGETIAREAKIPVAVLDPVATGIDAAPLDYYQQVMRKNFDTLTGILGAAGS